MRTVNAAHHRSSTVGKDGTKRRTLSRSRAARTEPRKQVGAGASSSAERRKPSERPRRDDVFFFLLAAFYRCPNRRLFSRACAPSIAHSPARAWLSRPGLLARGCEWSRERAWSGARGRDHSLPKRSECLLSFFFSHLLSSSLLLSLLSIHLRRAGCGRSGPRQRLRADTMREIAWRRLG